MAGAEPLSETAPGRRLIAGQRWLLALLALTLLSIRLAWGHAALLQSAPAQGETLQQAPAELRLKFNEPVSAMSLNWFLPDGKTLALKAESADGQDLLLALPSGVDQKGTYLLSWRVVSADGHPVANTLAYVVGQPGGLGARQAARQTAGSTSQKAAIWLARFLSYLCLFACLGAALFRTNCGDGAARWTRPFFMAMLPLLLADWGLQGLDLLGWGWSGLLAMQSWQAPLSSSYAWTLMLMALALVFAAGSLFWSSGRRSGLLAWLAVLLAAIAVAVSGHAGTAPPRWLARPAVALHFMMAVLWIGALLPLILWARDPHADARPLRRFSTLIVPVLALLVISGLVLAGLQLRGLGDLLQTAYGRVLLAKLCLIGLLLLLAALNRWRNTAQALQDSRGRQRLARTTAAELALAIAILGVLSLWRFTPPPRAIAMIPPAARLQFGNSQARTLIDSHGQHWQIRLRDAGGQDLPAQELKLSLENPAAGIEPVLAEARPDNARPGSSWEVNWPALPPGRNWRLELRVLVNDFEEIKLTRIIDLPLPVNQPLRISIDRPHPGMGH